VSQNSSPEASPFASSSRIVSPLGVLAEFVAPPNFNDELHIDQQYGF